MRCAECQCEGASAVPNGHVSDRGEWINATVVLCPGCEREWAQIREESINADE